MHINTILRLSQGCLLKSDRTAMVQTPDGFIITDCKAVLYMKDSGKPPTPVLPEGVYELVADEISLPAAKASDRISYDYTVLQLKNYMSVKRIKLGIESFSKELSAMVSGSQEEHMHLQFSGTGVFKFRNNLSSGWTTDKNKVYSTLEGERDLSLNRAYLRFIMDLKGKIKDDLRISVSENFSYVLLEFQSDADPVLVLLPCSVRKEQVKKAEQEKQEVEVPKEKISAEAEKIIHEVREETATEMSKILKDAMRGINEVTEKLALLKTRLDAYDAKLYKNEEAKRNLIAKLEEAKTLTSNI